MSQVPAHFQHSLVLTPPAGKTAQQCFVQMYEALSQPNVFKSGLHVSRNSHLPNRISLENDNGTAAITFQVKNDGLISIHCQSTLPNLDILNYGADNPYLRQITNTVMGLDEDAIFDSASWRNQGFAPLQRDPMNTVGVVSQYALDALESGDPDKFTYFYNKIGTPAGAFRAMVKDYLEVERCKTETGNWPPVILLRASQQTERMLHTALQVCMQDLPNAERGVLKASPDAAQAIDLDQLLNGAPTPDITASCTQVVIAVPQGIRALPNATVSPDRFIQWAQDNPCSILATFKGEIGANPLFDQLRDTGYRQGTSSQVKVDGVFASGFWRSEQLNSSGLMPTQVIVSMLPDAYVPDLNKVLEKATYLQRNIEKQDIATFAKQIDPSGIKDFVDSLGLSEEARDHLFDMDSGKCEATQVYAIMRGDEPVTVYFTDLQGKDEKNCPYYLLKSNGIVAPEPDAPEQRQERDDSSLSR